MSVLLSKYLVVEKVMNEARLIFYPTEK